MGDWSRPCNIQSFLYRCSHADLNGLSVEGIRSVYENISASSCTPLLGVVNGTGVVSTNRKCRNWIFNRESGYESITTEV